MAALAFEDLKPGARRRFGAYCVTEAEILEFARQFDPQRFHVDTHTPGGVIASGWHTCAMTMRMFYDGFLHDSTGAGAPGIDVVEWLRPVRPGMILSADVEVTGARVSRSRPQMGLVALAMEISDQSGEVLMRQKNAVMFGRRDPGAPIPEDAGLAPLAQERRVEPPVHAEDAINRTRFASEYEDVVPGACVKLGSYAFTHENMIAFASKYDPQPFHLDDEAAAKSHFGNLAASGWHTAAAYMKCFVATRDRMRAEATARGEKASAGRPSPGFTGLKWILPVFVGDVISYETVVMGKRPSSKPGFGKIFTRAQGFEQTGRLVFEQHGVGLAAMRD